MPTVEDKLAILEILAAANRSADEKDAKAHAGFYAENGIIEGDMEASGSGDDFLLAVQQIFDSEPGLKRHVGTNHLFSQNEHSVVVRSILTVFEGDEAPRIVATADIRDELVRDGEGWKISRHVVRMDPGTKKAMAEMGG